MQPAVWYRQRAWIAPDAASPRRCPAIRTAAALAVLLFTGCGKAPPSAQPPPPEVGVIRVEPQNAPLSRDLVGRLSAYRSADVRARVAGVLLKRVYTEGSDVRAGQELFEIDPAPLKAALSSAQAALAQAQATSTNNHIAAQRARDLAPKGFISRSDLDNAEAAERTAAAAVEAAEANIESARINLGYANVTAPIGGRAGQQQVTEGALVGQGAATLLTTIDQIDPLYVNFTMSVAEFGQLRQVGRSGAATLAAPDKVPVKLTLPDGSPYAETGTLDFSDTTVDPATGAIRLRARVPNPHHTLLPGMYVTLTATLGERHGVFLVPQPALQRDANGAFVLVVGVDGKVARKGVAIDIAQDGNWIVISGLAAGDQVIVSGVQRAVTGQSAKAVPWQPDSTARPAATAGVR